MFKETNRKGLLARAAVLILLPVACAGCSPKIIERVVVQHDTTQVVRIDSVWQYQRDSVFVREKGDTVFMYMEKIRYRDRFRVDTLITVREFRDTTAVEVRVEKSLSWAQKAKMEAFPWLVLSLLGALVWIFRKWLF